MEIKISNTNAYNNESVKITFVNAEFSKTVMLSDLPVEDKLLVYQFCAENNFKTVSITEGPPVNIEIKLVSQLLQNGTKNIEDITSSEKAQKTGMFLDVLNNIMMYEAEE